MTTMNTFENAVNTVRSKLNPQTMEQIGAVFAFHFKDTDTTATLDALGQQARGWLEGSPERFNLQPSFEVTITTADFAKLVYGELHPMAGMATGRMRLKGSIKDALKLDRLLKA
jgi:putative sterol carrier protein